MFQQRFNVALSRARDRMYLVRSLDEAMLKPDDLKAKVIRHFKNPMEGAVEQVGEPIFLCESEFEREVFRKLTERGWRLRPQVKAGDYRIDFVIEGADDRRLAVELDGDQYHGPERWAEDYNRQLALERMGWRFWRCWGSSWTLDSESCLGDLEATLRSLGISPLGSEVKALRYTEHRVVGELETEEAEASVVVAAPAAVVADAAVQPTRRPAPQSISMVETHRASQDDLFDQPRETLEPKLNAAKAEEIATSEAERTTPVARAAQNEEAAAFLYQNERVVEIGDKVVIAYNDDPTTVKTIVLTHNVNDDPKMGIIFVGRPIGQALLGQAEEESVDLPTGDGTREATILRIEKAALAV